MKIVKFVFLGSILSAFAVASAGCGQNIAGPYNMTETESNLASEFGQSQPSNCASSQATINLTNSGNSVSGNASGACFTENLQGTQNNNVITVSSFSLTPVGIQLPQTGAMGSYGYGGAMPVSTGYPSPYGSPTPMPSAAPLTLQACNYTGMLTMSGNNEFSGTLTLSGQPAAVPGYPQTVCPSSISLSATFI